LRKHRQLTSREKNIYGNHFRKHFQRAFSASRPSTQQHSNEILSVLLPSRCARHHSCPPACLAPSIYLSLPPPRSLLAFFFLSHPHHDRSRSVKAKLIPSHSPQRHCRLPSRV
ncbi:uncharacterized protein TERG_11524, partial [Trichophyton rubrum CBS 118892]